MVLIIEINTSQYIAFQIWIGFDQLYHSIIFCCSAKKEESIDEYKPDINTSIHTNTPEMKTDKFFPM